MSAEVSAERSVPFDNDSRQLTPVQSLDVRRRTSTRILVVCRPSGHCKIAHELIEPDRMVDKSTEKQSSGGLEEYWFAGCQMNEQRVELGS